MSTATIFCPGGSGSQTGEAVKKRYPKSNIQTCGDSIANVPQLLETNTGPYVIPIWNSHQGEIQAANFVWNQIEEAKIKLADLWAKSIQFWFVSRTGDRTSHREIGSVPVAETQCSGFLKRRGAKLKPYSLTTVAFTEYRTGAALDGVLVAPGQGENDANYKVVSKKTANPNNFTSFVRLAPVRAHREDIKAGSRLTGVTMRPLGVSLKDAEQSFFAEMLGTAKDLKDIPKLIFVLKRTAKIGLLFEGPQLYASDLLDAEDTERGDVRIHEDVGAIAKPYAEELHELFQREFPNLQREHFILHRGAGGNTCLFACPALGLYTHGYEIETIEPVIRFYISKLFQRWNQGDLDCTPVQAKFFQRYKSSWQKKGAEFIKFKEISAT